jgi:phosphatidylglycerophosphatase C
MNRISTEAEIVSIFDFDGTITKKNTAVPFLKLVSGRCFNQKFITRIPDAVAYYLNIIDVDRLNRSIVGTFLKNLSRDELFEYGQVFYSSVLPGLIRDSAFKRINWHKDQGHQCWLATSAYNIYADYWAKQNGFDGVVSTKIEFDEAGYATGRVQGKSCNGEEKLRRIKEVIGEPKVIYAYGDSSGDKELLEFATHPFYRKFK